MVTSFYIASSNCLSARLQINRSVAVNRNAFTASHVMRRQKFYVKLMPFHRPNHSNGRSTIHQIHLKCRKVITKSIHYKLRLSPTLQSRWVFGASKSTKGLWVVILLLLWPGVGSVLCYEPLDTKSNTQLEIHILKQSLISNTCRRFVWCVVYAHALRCYCWLCYNCKI